MKKILLIIFISTIVFCSCQHEQKDTNIPPEIHVKSRVDVEKWRAEIIPVDSSFINGRINIFNEKSDIISEFGSLPKITFIEDSGYLSFLMKEKVSSVPYQMAFKGIIFDGIGDKMMLRKITFGNNLYLKTPKIELREGLAVWRICELYPESCKLTIPRGNGWSGHIELRVAKEGGLPDLRWFLFFRGEALVSIELHRFR